MVRMSDGPYTLRARGRSAYLGMELWAGLRQHNLDHFTGSLTEDGRTIDAVNNDGARAFDEPHTLQRVGCL